MSIPTSIRLACLAQLASWWRRAPSSRERFVEKAARVDDVVKAGRTHLQDAMPIRLGQEMAAYAGTVERGLRRVEQAADFLRDLGIGGSAVGTGVNVEPEYPKLMVTSSCRRYGARSARGQRPHPAHAEHG